MYRQAGESEGRKLDYKSCEQRLEVSRRIAGTMYGWNTPDGGQGGAGCIAGDIFEPSLKPVANFNASTDCELLRKAMKGIGTDENAIIDIMGRRSATQRNTIVTQFKAMYGKDLISEFKSELSGHFYDCVRALCYLPEEFDAVQLYEAMKGAGTDEDTLIEILCSRTNGQIAKIKEAFTKLYQKDLENEIVSETSRHFKRVLVSLLQASRDENPNVDLHAAKNEAEKLYKAGEKHLGTDESQFLSILCTRSYEQLRAIFDEYKKLTKHDIEQALKSEMSGDLLDAFLAIVSCARNKPKYFAQLLEKSMKGLGTSDKMLIRIVVSRCEIDMGRIKKEFQAAYGKSLATWIKDDTSGDYERLLLTLIGER
ncbi:hypothetical protein EG68_04353 [Paragonimus skrjabini miyazakii]|uniref:Annexin n=1 Tax=Paragonimus skrjabini miyazakii TaxID=59628 RepID=A0A8S9YZU5_9TREM|nr:hypothetical protein EG68_04353 [Paragonimus skrjabini miyazakii]